MRVKSKAAFQMKFIALARHGIDIRELISKKAPIEIVELLSEIFGVEPEASVIAQALGVRNEDITLCEKLDYVTNKLCIALAGKGYDIREFWMNTASLAMKVLPKAPSGAFCKSLCR